MERRRCCLILLQIATFTIFTKANDWPADCQLDSTKYTKCQIMPSQSHGMCECLGCPHINIYPWCVNNKTLLTKTREMLSCLQCQKDNCWSSYTPEDVICADNGIRNFLELGSEKHCICKHNRVLNVMKCLRISELVPKTWYREKMCEDMPRYPLRMNRTDNEGLYHEFHQTHGTPDEPSLTTRSRHASPRMILPRGEPISKTISEMDTSSVETLVIALCICCGIVVILSIATVTMCVRQRKRRQDAGCPATPDNTNCQPYENVRNVATPPEYEYITMSIPNRNFATTEPQYLQPRMQYVNT